MRFTIWAISILAMVVLITVTSGMFNPTHAEEWVPAEGQCFLKYSASREQCGLPVETREDDWCVGNTFAGFPTQYTASCEHFESDCEYIITWNYRCKRLKDECTLTSQAHCENNDDCKSGSECEYCTMCCVTGCVWTCTYVSTQCSLNPWDCTCPSFIPYPLEDYAPDDLNCCFWDPSNGGSYHHNTELAKENVGGVWRYIDPPEFKYQAGVAGRDCVFDYEEE